MALPTTRRDRWLALALLLAVIALVYLVLVHPLFTRPLLDINADITDLQERDQRVQAACARQVQHGAHGDRAHALAAKARVHHRRERAEHVRRAA